MAKNKKLKVKEDSLYEQMYDGTTPLANAKWEMFCRLYTRDPECFNHMGKSYAYAFGHDPKESTSLSARGSMLLKRRIVAVRADYLLRQNLSDDFIDKEIAWVATQREDLSSKMRAIKHRDQLAGRLVERHEVTNVNQLIDQLHSYANNQTDNPSRVVDVERPDPKPVVQQAVENEQPVQDSGQGSEPGDVSDEPDTASVRDGKDGKEHHTKSSSDGIHYTRVH